jgi:hypothetical protein
MLFKTVVGYNKLNKIFWDHKYSKQLLRPNVYKANTLTTKGEKGVHFCTIYSY